MENKMAESRIVVRGGAFSRRLKSPLLKKKNKKAFTLAEVLVTLTIIGVVSAMTIPTLHQRHNEQVTVKKVQKFYSTMSQAFQKAINEYGDVDTWGIEGSKQTDALIIYNYLIKDNFKIIKDCGFNNNGGCIYDGNYKYLNGNNSMRYANDSYYNYYKVMLNDGSSIWFRADKAENELVDLFIDVNGNAAPNQWGKDLFLLYVVDGKLIPSGTDKNNNKMFFDRSCNKSGAGYGCAAWLVYKGNMDYLHCNDLKWNGKQKCSKK